MTLKTNAAKREPLHIAVEGNVTSDVMIVGQDFKERKQELQLGAISQGTELVRQLRVIAKGAHRETFEITRVETSPNDLIQAEVGEVRNLNEGAVRMQVVTVRIPEDSRVCRFVGDERSPAGQVILHTTHPIARTLTIRVLFAILPRETAGGRR